MEWFLWFTGNSTHIHGYGLYYTLKSAIITKARGRRIMANMPAFQASDASSILAARTKQRYYKAKDFFGSFFVILGP
jgi:hypothetical protein